MTNPYRVECWKNGLCQKTRRFATAQKAVDFANDWHDEHEGRWDVQIITPTGVIYQTNTNGNQGVEAIK